MTEDIPKYRWQTWQRPMLEFIGNVEKKTVIEVGCGDGEIITNIDAKERYACDINRDRLLLINDRNVKVFQQDIYKPFNLNKKFDIIILCAILEHLESPEQAIKNLSTLAHENTKIMVLVPYKEERPCEDHKQIYDLRLLKKHFKDYHLEGMKFVCARNPYIGKKGLINIIKRKLIAFTNVFVSPYLLIKHYGAEIIITKWVKK